MSKRSAAPKKAGEGKESEAKVTAIVLADSYTNDFKPISIDLPRALIPLVNVPMIDYVLEFLVSNGVDEIIVLCSSHSKLIEEYVNATWTRTEEINVRCITFQTTNPGEALRAIHDEDIIRNDFILVPADLVTSFTGLAGVLQRHKERRSTDPCFLMTLVLHKNPPQTPFVNHPQPAQSPLRNLGSVASLDGSDYVNDREEPFTFDFNERAAGNVVQPLQERVTAIYDAGTMQLLGYKQWYVSAQFHDVEEWKRKPEAPLVEVTLEKLKEHRKLSVRTDVVDSNIVICAPEVLGLFQSNFDYVDIKCDTVRGLIDDELLQNKIAVEIIEQTFLERARSFNHYLYLSHAVVTRWSYPLVPDLMRRGEGESKWDIYELGPNSTLVHTSAKVHNNAQLQQNVCIGAGTIIQAATIRNSVIGKNCVIEAGAEVINSVLWDNVRVEKAKETDRGHSSATYLNGCVVGSGCVLGGGCNIEPGTVLGPGVVISPAFSPDGQRRYVREGDKKEVDAVGPQGLGILWEPTEEEENILDVSVPMLKYNEDELGYGLDDLLTNETDQSYSLGGKMPRSVGKGGGGGEGKLVGVLKEDDTEKFMREMEETIDRPLRMHEHATTPISDRIDNTILEINGLKFGYDKPIEDCAVGIMRGVALYCLKIKGPPKGVGKDVHFEFAKQSKLWRALYDKFLPSTMVQIEMLDGFAEFAISHKAKGIDIFTENFHWFLLHLWNAEIVDTEAVKEWRVPDKENDTKEFEALKQSKGMEMVLQTIKDQEDGSEESEEESD